MATHAPANEGTPERIRAAAPADVCALRALFEAVGLFQPHEVVELAALLRRCLAGDLGADHHWLVYDDAGIAGAAYYAPDASPERIAAGAWNLYFIGVQPDRQGAGCGSALIRQVENALRAHGVADVLVETSGRAGFAATRAFYRSHGYRAAARVADAYAPGDDKIVFRKRLVPVDARR